MSPLAERPGKGLRRTVGVLVLATLVGLPLAARLRAQAAIDAGLLLGQGQVGEGDFERAVVTLDAAIERLRADETRRIELSRAHLFKAVALLGLDQRGPAETHFRSAITLDKSLRLRDDQFSPRVIRAFEEARRAVASEARPPR